MIDLLKHSTLSLSRARGGSSSHARTKSVVRVRNKVGSRVGLLQSRLLGVDMGGGSPMLDP